MKHIVHMREAFTGVPKKFVSDDDVVEDLNGIIASYNGKKCLIPYSNLLAVEVVED